MSGEKEGSKMKSVIIAEAPENIRWEADRICLQVPHGRCREIRNEDLIIAYLVISSHEEKKYEIPEFELVSEDMKGCLILYDREGQAYNIYTTRTGKREGAVFFELAVHLPNIILGYHPWIREKDEQEFEELVQMVDAMRH